MASYTLMTDMTCDLSKEMLEELQVCAVPMAFQLGSNAYQHYPDEREITLEEFYVRLKAGEDAVTSQINPATYIEYFERELKEGKDILYLCFKSGNLFFRFRTQSENGKYPDFHFNSFFASLVASPQPHVF